MLEEFCWMDAWTITKNICLPNIFEIFRLNVIDCTFGFDPDVCRRSCCKGLLSGKEKDNLSLLMKMNAVCKYR